MLNQNLLLGDDGYLIQRSLRFRASASANLTRTPSVSGSQTTYTYSSWIKRGTLASANYLVLWSSEASGANYTSLVYYADAFYWATNGTVLTSTAVYRDTSAWYHVVLAVDTTQGTSTDRVKIFVNGSQVTLSGSYPTASQALQINTSSYVHKIGFGLGFGQYFDGYMAETNFIDGQALTPSSFGETDPITGVWKPKKYAGTYGTNGFYLNFSDNSAATAAAIGKDYSGNGNNWTPNNISVTAGATYDSMTDVPTLTSESAGNYCVISPIDKSSGAVSDGNLLFTDGGASAWDNARGTIGVRSGKFYWEMTATNVVTSVLCASIASPKMPLGNLPGQYSTYGVTYYPNGQLYSNAVTSPSAYGNSWTTGDIIGFALDMDSGKVWFSKNGTWQNSGDPVAGTNPALSGLLSIDDTWMPITGTYYSGSQATFNFGQRPFAFSPPTGFKALNTFNLPDATIKAGNKHFDATTYTGTLASLAVTNSGGFQPDLVWAKDRSAAQQHMLFDSVRGVYNFLTSNTTSAEGTNNQTLTAFNSNGFQLGTNGTINNTVANVAWQWKAGGSAVSNTAGSITSQVSANASAGFSVVSFTGNATAGATVGHGLGVAPKMIITKPRSQVDDWVVYHSSLGGSQYLILNSTAAAGSATNYWGTPNSTTFGLSGGGNNRASAMISYCFSEVAGYSKFGSYTGNGSADGPFVHLGFRPKFVMIKRTDSSTGASWFMWDTARNQYNLSTNVVYADGSVAEQTYGQLDIVSNGFKLRGTDVSWNANGSPYIYMAFAENPFKNSLAR